MQRVRRSSRLAAKAATTAGTNAAAVSQAVEEAEKKIKEHTARATGAVSRGRGRARGGGGDASRGQGGKRQRTEEDDSKQDPSKDSSFSDESTEDEAHSIDSKSTTSVRDRRGDGKELKALWLYEATKKHHRDLLPTPFDVSNPQILKNPTLWPLLLEVCETSPEQIEDAFGLDGELTRRFSEALAECYDHESVGESARIAFAPLFRKIKSAWKILGRIYFTVRTPEEMFPTSRTILAEVVKLFQALDAEFLGAVFGERAAESFRASTRIPLSLFPPSSKKWARLAMKVGTQGGKKRIDVCGKCGKYVKRGRFEQHNAVCTGP